MRLISLSVIAVFALSGCSVDSFIFSAGPKKPLILIEHPPNRIGYWGSLEQEDMDNMQTIYKMMQKEKYEPYVYRFPIGVDLKHDVSVEKSRVFTGSTTIHKKGRFK